MSGVHEIRHLVAAIEEATAAAAARAEARASGTISEQIGSDLGCVTVSGTGDLRAIDLDPGSLRYTTEQALASAIVSAIHRAEKRARVEFNPKRNGGSHG